MLPESYLYDNHLNFLNLTFQNNFQDLTRKNRDLIKPK
jgi:hypothetical protein